MVKKATKKVPERHQKLSEDKKEKKWCYENIQKPWWKWKTKVGWAKNFPKQKKKQKKTITFKNVYKRLV